MDRAVHGSALTSATTASASAPARVGVRYPALDGMRAVAVLTVMVAHGSLRLWSDDLRFGGGGLGVQIFFVLSGFLITSLLLREHLVYGRISLKDFYLRRVLRIFPLYYAMLFLYALVLPHVSATHFSTVYVSTDMPGYSAYWHSMLTYVPFLQNYLADIDVVHLGPGIMWSLAIEEQFYLFWPLLLIGLLKVPWRRAVPAFLVLALVLSTGARVLTVHGVLPAPSTLEWMTHTGLAGLACGSLLAWLRTREGDDLSLPRSHGLFAQALAWGVLAMLAGARFVPAIRSGPVFAVPYPDYIEPLVIAFAVATIVDRLISAPRAGTLLGSRPMRHIGRVSYGMYLLHPLVLGATAAWLWHRGEGTPPWWALPLFVLATIGLATLSYRFFEQPILRFKHRFQRVSL